MSPPSTWVRSASRARGAVADGLEDRVEGELPQLALREISDRLASVLEPDGLWGQYAAPRRPPKKARTASTAISRNSGCTATPPATAMISRTAASANSISLPPC